MAIVVNGNGSISGISVGGLPDGSVDSDTLASGIDKTSISDSGDATAITIDSGERIGIGNTVAGTMNGVNSSILTIGTGSGHSGMTVYTGSTNEGTINFADDTSGSGTYKGMVRYDHNTNALTLHSNATEAIKIDSTGAVTMPKQPAFQAQLSNKQTDLATGTWIQIPFNVEIFDQNSDFNTSTHYFTAPVTGKYQLQIQIRYEDINSSDYHFTSIETSNRSYYDIFDPGGEFSSQSDYHATSIVVLADMDANDTAKCETYQAGGSTSRDIDQGSATVFTGFLVA